jgi:hypothetical protein
MGKFDRRERKLSNMHIQDIKAEKMINVMGFKKWGEK